MPETHLARPIFLSHTSLLTNISHIQDLVRFRKAMAGKWKNMDKIFRDIDKSGDGKIDVHEFSSCCKRLKLGWSEFQVLDPCCNSESLC